MGKIGKKVKTVLEGYANFLAQAEIAATQAPAAPTCIPGRLLIDPFVGDNHLFSSEQSPQMPGDYHLLLRLGCG